jgi:uncharacterized surface anchored protein
MKKLLILGGLVGTLVLAVMATAAGAQTYPPTTIQVGGTVVTRGPTGTGTSANLPFTGSNNTATLGLVALGLVALGLVLLVAFHRRRHVFD